MITKQDEQEEEFVTESLTHEHKRKIHLLPTIHHVCFIPASFDLFSTYRMLNIFV